MRGLNFDRSNNTVSVGARVSRLTEKEGELLSFFLRYEGRIVTRKEIFEELWGSSDLLSSNVVDVHVMNLRKKIRSRSGPVIETVRGNGYKLVVTRKNPRQAYFFGLSTRR